jgi:hypothetical protein
MVQQRAGFPPLSMLAILALFMALSRPTSAQSLQPGDRIRATPAHSFGDHLIGQFVRSTSDSIWLRPQEQGQPIALALADGLRIDRSLGRHSRAGTGALIGAGVGAAVTVLFLSGFCGGDNLCDGDEQVRAAAIFGLPSVAVGAGIGALIKTERWTPVARVTAADGFGIGVMIRW